MAFGIDCSAAVERAAQRINGATEQSRPHGYANDLPGASDPMPRFDPFGLVEQNASQNVAVQGEGEADLTVLEAHEFVQPQSGSPDTCAMPSAIASTRPTCSATGASDVSLTRSFALVSQLSRAALMFVTVQLLADSIEVRSPAVAHGRVAAMQLDAGNQGRIGAKREWELRAERRVERINDVRGLLVRKRRCGHDLDGMTLLSTADVRLSLTARRK